jgi:protein-S-isoprenylcysteine O-methyltransferase Ste14
MSDLTAYGHWQLVIFNSLFILFFVFIFFKPNTRRDWRTFGTFSAFVVALFTEMYGFPLTIYLLSGWLGSRFPEINWFSHDSSHLLQTLLGWKGNAHAGPLHLLSNVLIVGGLFLLAVSWRVLYNAQKIGVMASSGPYTKVRHPQYTAFMVIMIGFLIQWPTLPTLAMFPFLALTYYRLARREEQASLDAFGQSYARYMENTPRFLPKFSKVRAQGADSL